jgi:hypothetical protein
LVADYPIFNIFTIPAVSLRGQYTVSRYTLVVEAPAEIAAVNLRICKIKEFNVSYKSLYFKGLPAI